MMKDCRKSMAFTGKVVIEKVKVVILCVTYRAFQATFLRKHLDK